MTEISLEVLGDKGKAADVLAFWWELEENRGKKIQKTEEATQKFFELFRQCSEKAFHRNGSFEKR